MLCAQSKGEEIQRAAAEKYIIIVILCPLRGMERRACFICAWVIQRLLFCCPLYTRRFVFLAA